MAQQLARTAPAPGPPPRARLDQLRLGQRAAGSRLAGADLDARALPLAAALQGHEPPARRRRPLPRPEPQARPGRAPQPPSAVACVGYAQQFLQGSTWSSLHWSYRLTMPTLVIGGTRDRLVPAANSLLLAYRLPDSRLHLLPDEGHLMLFDPLSASSALLADFFSSPDHARSTAWRTGDDGRRLRARGAGAARRARRAAAEGAQRRLSRVGARARGAEGVRRLVAEDDEGLALFDRLALGAQDRFAPCRRPRPRPASPSSSTRGSRPCRPRRRSRRRRPRSSKPCR